jgi:hypothetical protein
MLVGRLMEAQVLGPRMLEDLEREEDQPTVRTEDKRAITTPMMENPYLPQPQHPAQHRLILLQPPQQALPLLTKEKIPILIKTQEHSSKLKKEIRRMNNTKVMDRRNRMPSPILLTQTTTASKTPTSKSTGMATASPAPNHGSTRSCLLFQILNLPLKMP